MAMCYCGSWRDKIGVLFALHSDGLMQAQMSQILSLASMLLPWSSPEDLKAVLGVLDSLAPLSKHDVNLDCSGRVESLFLSAFADCQLQQGELLSRVPSSVDPERCC